MAAKSGARPGRARPKAAAPKAAARDRTGPSRVRRRKVFYVAGFDPASPRKYHRIYTAQAALQGELTGARFEVGDLTEIDDITSGWTIQAEFPGGEKVEVDYRFLHWFDLVRLAWPKDDLGLFVGACRGLVSYFRCGLMRRARAEAPVVFVTALWPMVIGIPFLLLFGLGVALAAWAGALVAQRLGAPWWAGAAPALLLLLTGAPVWRRLDSVLPIGWLARGMTAVSSAARGKGPAFGDRATAFAGKMIEAAQEPGLDEVLIVAHSMGGQQACRAVGRAVMMHPGFGKGVPVNLLTLGSLLPFYSMTAQDPAYRQEMAALAAADWIGWLDVTGPSDPGSSAGLHPLAGLDLPETEDRPVRRAPRFGHLLSPETFKSLKTRPLDYHFQYLMAGERVAEYDFFRLTAGPERMLAWESP